MRQAGAQPRCEIERVILRIQQVVRRFRIAESRTKLRTNAERHPDVRRDQRVCAAESVRRDTDDSIGLSVNLKCATDKIIAATVALPKAVACHHDSDVRVWFTFLSSIEPAPKRLHAHHREIILRSQKSEASPHLVIAPDAGDGELEHRDIGKHVSAVLTQLAVFVV